MSNATLNKSDANAPAPEISNMSHNNHKIQQTGITFDDVLVQPRYSEIVPSEVETTTRLTKRISFCLLYTSPSPRDQRGSRMPSSA